ncbi:MAG: hypothetical protein P8Y70_08145 [Candidatus Lokiarchaeota archaeon]
MMIWTTKFHVCLECEQEFENKNNIAICPKCLEQARKKFENGIRSQYETVNMYLESITL